MSLSIKTILFILLFSTKTVFSQTKQHVKMHRQQDTTLSESGWYYAHSTEGHFSVELPIPFNDATIKVKNYTTYIVGGTSLEGYKFSVVEMRKKWYKKVNLKHFTDEFEITGNRVSNIQRIDEKSYKSLYFEVEDLLNGAFFKLVLVNKRLYTIILEYPLSEKETIKAYKESFFSSFKVLND